jgi:GntR family transcriptional repressor for pyruvate dehydrogenase complex
LADDPFDTTGLPPLAPGQLGSREALLTFLEERIVGGAWPPGAKLPSERNLCRHFVLSRPVVREVLLRLEERGAIETHPARGSFVRQPAVGDASRTLGTLLRQTGATARQLVVARTMLECEAAALAAANATPGEREQMQTVLDLLASTAELEQRARLDVAFHEAIARASGNPVLHVMFGSIRPLVLGLVVRSLGDPRVREAGEPLHAEILAAIAGGDGAAAADAMRRHVRLALELYGDDLDRPLDQVLSERAERTAQVDELVRRVGELGAAR